MRGDYVLLLTANSVERGLLVKILEGKGYSVFETDSPRVARKIIARFPVDAVLVDPGFGRDESLAFLAHVQAHNPGVARVLMTHHPQSKRAMRLLGLGRAHALLLKPVVEPELLYGLSRALHKAQEGPGASRAYPGEIPLPRFFDRLHLGSA